MSDVIHLMGMDWKNGVLFVAAIIIVAVFILQKTDWLIEKLGIKSRRQLAEEKQDRDIKELNDHAKRSDENFDKIFHSINNVKDSIDSLSQRVEDMQRRADENEMHMLRDRIGQAYRYYKAKGEWTAMEKEAFDGLIQSYEKAGGTNGMVHSKAIPESFEWRIIDE